MMEGLTSISEMELSDGTSLNLDSYRDQFSPYSHIDIVQLAAGGSDALWVDAQYGLVYSDWIAQGGAVYGVTERMPKRNFDEMAELGFLRVPFARFPRLRLRSRKEIETILDRLSRTLPVNAQILLRGQTREYTLGRPTALMEALYGVSDVIEPSLTTSAKRCGIDVNEIMPEWSGLLRFLVDSLRPLIQEEKQSGQIDDWFNSYSFSRFSFAIAQHYGLPSSGLDVTGDLDVALFFSLRQFMVLSESEGIGTYEAKRDWSEPSVIYVFVLPTQHHSIKFANLKPSTLPITRPARQNAFFLHRGWGLSGNDCARLLAFAMYVDEDFETGEIPAASHLFPGEREDNFAATLGNFVGRSLSPNRCSGF